MRILAINEDELYNIGSVIKKMRCGQHKTQKGLAEAAGISRQALSRIETLKAIPQWNTAVLLLNQLGCQPRLEFRPLPTTYKLMEG